jgi:hypothetical protein
MVKTRWTSHRAYNTSAPKVKTHEDFETAWLLRTAFSEVYPSIPARDLRSLAEASPLLEHVHPCPYQFPYHSWVRSTRRPQVKIPVTVWGEDRVIVPIHHGSQDPGPKQMVNGTESDTLGPVTMDFEAETARANQDPPTFREMHIITHPRPLSLNNRWFED